MLRLGVKNLAVFLALCQPPHSIGAIDESLNPPQTRGVAANGHPRNIPHGTGRTDKRSDIWSFRSQGTG
ncbi:hypothetical protein CC2G_012882 [Coprinopsis cinerea AmutBmut pab1-1]|nr:hypothetical protein CC2G_012882 [Coprinopsis cinerea AmutBmut pab1-1]